MKVGKFWWAESLSNGPPPQKKDPASWREQGHVQYTSLKPPTEHVLPEEFLLIMVVLCQTKVRTLRKG